MTEGDAWLLAALGTMLYAAPSLLAYFRAHHNVGAILALNILLGWTLLGWIVAFVWACSSVAPAPGKATTLPSGLPLSAKRTKECAACFSEIDARATVCPNCRREIEA